MEGEVFEVIIGASIFAYYEYFKVEGSLEVVIPCENGRQLIIAGELEDSHKQNVMFLGYLFRESNTWRIVVKDELTWSKEESNLSRLQIWPTGYESVLIGHSYEIFATIPKEVFDEVHIADISENQYVYLIPASTYDVTEYDTPLE